ncbi:TonB-dependent siderophore receptor [Nitrosococcus halophilus Nc 4]|uniref:TonB-dependent siderophore receptor n=1 Tax=Nitrosococcus halophilus (strain Nc4) TaxID=472759 RepID=D5C321_NITHN|nr:TonB-dependent siderophore receptor [Nitrosococcus halophilus]ADE14913.1 TonB-dependent siderophore receptor [Nitrosococcus halophilus Nc 4]
MRKRLGIPMVYLGLLLIISLTLFRPAAADTAVTLDIPAQPLEQAVTVLASQTQLTIGGDTRLLRGHQAPPLRGSYTPEAALRALLAGTGITYRFTGAKTVTLEQAVALEEGAMMLGPVEIEGAAESAFGPVEGYRASRSATGTKTDTPLIEIPQSVSVITQERLQDQRADSLDEALRYTPGVQGETFGFNPRATSLKIRGFDSITTGLFQDGLQLRTPTTSGEAFNPEPYGAERIEALRGPASVLYGQSSPGGIINIVTKRPPQEPLRELQFLAGNFDRYEGRFDFGDSIDEGGVFSYRLTGLVRDSNTQVDFIENDRRFIAPALTWRPTENTSLTFLSHYQEDELGDFQFLPSQGTVLPNPNGSLPASRFTGEPDFDKLERTVHSVGYLLEHHVGETWTFRQNLRYSRSDLDRAVVFSAGLRDDLRTLDRFAFGNDKDLDVFALDNQAQVNFSTGPIEHTLLVGVDYQNFDVRNLTPFGSAPAIDIFNPVYGAPVPSPPIISDMDTSLQQIGFYFQDQLKLYDKWVLSLGGRQDWANTERMNNLAGTGTEQDDDKFSGRVGLVYLADMGLAPYFSYSESFLPIADVNLAGEPFAPETARQYEIGVKYQPPGWNSFVTVAAFDLERQNVRTPDPNNPLNQVQTGEVRSRGVELEGVASLNFGLDVIASYTYLDAEITKSNVPGEEGERPTQVPEHQGSVWAKYTVQKGLLRGLGLGGGVRYTGSSFADTPNTFESPDFTMVDATISYDWRQFRFALNASNLFNEEAFVCFSGGNFCSFGPQRTVVGTIRYRW